MIVHCLGCRKVFQLHELNMGERGASVIERWPEPEDIMDHSLDGLCPKCAMASILAIGRTLDMATIIRVIGPPEGKPS